MDVPDFTIAPRDRFIPAEQTAGEPAEITADVIAQIDKASKLRSYKTASSS